MKKLIFVFVFMLILGSTSGVVHAQQKPKAIVPGVPPATVENPVVAIPVPAEDVAQLKTSIEEYQQKINALNAEYRPQWDRILARAALRVKLSPEQFDSLTPEPDGRGGFQWVPRKVEAAKIPVKVN